MKILIINNLFPPYNRGGAESVVKNQVLEFAGKGDKVAVLTSRPFFSKKKITHEFGDIPVFRFFPCNIWSYYNLHKLPAFFRFFWFIFDVFNLHSYFYTHRIIRQFRPGVIYTHNLTGIGLIAILAIKKSGVRHIHTVHDVALYNPSGLIIYGHENSFLNTSFFARVYQYFTRRIFAFCPEIIFPSKWLMGFYQDKGYFKKARKIHRPNYKITTQNLITQRTSQNPNHTVLTFVGFIESHKGIFFLIDILQALDPQYKFILNIVGEGSSKNKLLHMIKNDERFVYHGWQEKEALEDIIDSSDYTIVPSLCYENLPTVIGESLEQGVPVIASRIGGIPEVIKDGVNGILFTPGGENDLKNKLESVILK